MIYSRKIKGVFIRLYRAYFPERNIRDFIRHNQRIWPRADFGNARSAEILFEYNAMHSSIIAFSYLANVLRDKFNAKIVAYTLDAEIQLPLTQRVKQFIARVVLPSDERRIFSSFGVQSFFSVNPTGLQLDKASRLFNEVYPLLRSKRDVENLAIDGVWIGDLIYDTYLRKYSVPTIDVQDEKFQQFLRGSLGIFIFWQEYFDTHEVRAINVTHCVYNNAIPLRIAVQRGIPAYQTNASHVYRMSRNNLFAYGDFRYFPVMFNKLSLHEQEAGRQEACKRIDLRFSGKVGVDMRYSTKSAYGQKRNQPVLRKSSKFKVLVAAHCFFDSPHSYGNNLFPDFYEWFDFLGQVSNQTDYDWYVKTHPDFLPGNIQVIQYFLNKYPKLTLIDAATSHHQLIEEGIGCVLTTYGTIGFEYAALGLLVVNASLCNPHIAYNFNLHPKSVEEYGRILRSLDTQSLKINRAEVYEYYYMKFVRNTENWLFEDYQKILVSLGGYTGQFTTQVYASFLGELTEARHRQILTMMNNFVDSGDFRLNYEHMKNTPHG